MEVCIQVLGQVHDLRGRYQQLPLRALVPKCRTYVPHRHGLGVQQVHELVLHSQRTTRNHLEQ